MSTYTILVTDYAWPNLDTERQILRGIDAELLVAETGEEAELLTLAPQADGILTNWQQVTAVVLQAATQCRVVSRYGVGVDNIDVAAATACGIAVTNVPDYCMEETSDHALALLLACARRLWPLLNLTKQGGWDLQSEQPYFRLRGRTLGLVGYGRIAQALVPKAQALGLRVLAYTPRLTAVDVAPGVDVTNDLHDLLRRSDYVSLHAPTTAVTKHLINAEALRQMKPTAYLINTARGALVDETALYTAVSEGWILGAALDVLQNEAPDTNNPLLTLDNVLITPHAAFYSREAITELTTKAAQNIVAILQGQPTPYIVNKL